MKKTLAILFLLLAPCSAQEPRTLDLTTAPSAPLQKFPVFPTQEECGDKVQFSVGSGVAFGSGKWKGQRAYPNLLQLTFRPLTPVALDGEFAATVTIENLEKKPVVIPWQPDWNVIVESLRNQKQGTWHAAWIGLQIRAGKRTQYLRSSLPFYAVDTLPDTWLKLEPHQSAVLKIKSALRCVPWSGTQTCEPIEITEGSVLVAVWEQQQVSYKIDTCYGSQTSYEDMSFKGESAPFKDFSVKADSH